MKHVLIIVLLISSCSGTRRYLKVDISLYNQHLPQFFHLLGTHTHTHTQTHVRLALHNLSVSQSFLCLTTVMQDRHYFDFHLTDEEAYCLN